MEKYDVSIIVPIYKVENYLDKCISSIINQTYERIQIILVDDGSPDSSPAICDKYAHMDARVQVIHKSNGGVVSARKAGCEAATGTYIGFVDGDDWIEPEMIENLYELMIHDNADTVLAGAIEDVEGECHFQSNKIKEGVYKTEEERTYLYSNMICCESYFGMGILPYFHNKLFHRDVLLSQMKAMDDEIRVGDDVAVIFPALLQAKCIVIQNQFHYHYCLRRSSMMFASIDEESEYLNAIRLHKYMQSQIGIKMLNEYDLREQLQKYLIHNVLVRAYGKCALLDEQSALFPFKNINKGDSVFIYGAGVLGKAVSRYLSVSADVIMAGWVDRDAAYYQKQGYPVDTPEKLQKNTQAKIIIAILSKKISNEVKETLLSQGFESDQVIEPDIDTNKFKLHPFTMGLLN